MLKITCGSGNGAGGTDARTNITALLVTLPMALKASTFTLILSPVNELASVTSYEKIFGL